jgi:CRP-like cAMP-binding protein
MNTLTPNTQFTTRHTHAVRQLLLLLNSLHPVDDDVVSYFDRFCVLRFFKKGAFIIHRDDICDQYSFIFKGIVRGFIQNKDREITTWISVENELVTSIHSLHQQKPALENIEVVEDSWLLQLSVDKMEQLYRDYPKFNINGRILLQQYYRDAELRAYLGRIPDAEEKYHFFLENYPQLDKRVPQKLIASYLGIRQETLSRIRRRL